MADGWGYSGVVALLLVRRSSSDSSSVGRHQQRSQGCSSYAYSLLNCNILEILAYQRSRRRPASPGRNQSNGAGTWQGTYGRGAARARFDSSNGNQAPACSSPRARLMTARNSRTSRLAVSASHLKAARFWRPERTELARISRHLVGSRATERVNRRFGISWSLSNTCRCLLSGE
jgi:hypothetical protein